jgi:hypothetical protein
LPTVQEIFVGDAGGLLFDHLALFASGRRCAWQTG